MQAFRLGNMDLLLRINSEEFSELEGLVQTSESKVFAESKLRAQNPSDPLNNRSIELIYDSSREGSCGLDTSEIINHLKEGTIPIYLSQRAVDFLKQNGRVESAYQSARVTIKLN